jgi:hypothetical protein
MARPLVAVADVGRTAAMRGPGESLYPVPHALRFDFAATATGAGWIDELAVVARSRLAITSHPEVIGHFDWRVGNLGFRDERLVAIYDWDSVARGPEPVIVGQAAGQFCCDLHAGDADPFPTVDDMLEFVRDYEYARGTPFSTDELDVLDAANLALACYGARCQHSDMRLHLDLARDDTTAWIRLLRERGTRLWG